MIKTNLPPLKSEAPILLLGDGLVIRTPSTTPKENITICNILAIKGKILSD